MRIVRAVCGCGYVSAKARDGRQFEHAWVAVWDASAQALTDVEAERSAPFAGTCPRCGGPLALQPAAITALCKDDCGHRYPWVEAATERCPRCNYRPHGFETDQEPHLAELERIATGCGCACAYGCRGLGDAFCPRCGARPTRARRGDVRWCLVHDTVMTVYRPRADEVFWRPRYRLGPRWPNARTCEPAPPGVKSTKLFYCPTCDALRAAAPDDDE